MLSISEMETPFGKRILIKKRKIKEQKKIILAQYFEIFQISSSGKILWQKNLKKKFSWRWNFEILRQDDFHLLLDNAKYFITSRLDQRVVHHHELGHVQNFGPFHQCIIIYSS